MPYDSVAPSFLHFDTKSGNYNYSNDAWTAIDFWNVADSFILPFLLFSSPPYIIHSTCTYPQPLCPSTAHTPAASTDFHDHTHTITMSVHARLTKLNPTTLTTPSPRAGGSILKITCSPYLSIQNPDLATLKAARQNADGLFEVIVPVGGKVEVKIEAEVGCLMGDQGANLEFEVEEAVTEEVMKILDRVSLGNMPVKDIPRLKTW